MLIQYTLTYNNQQYDLTLSDAGFTSTPTLKLTRADKANLQDGDEQLLEEIHRKINLGNSAATPKPRLEYEYNERSLKRGGLESITAQILQAGSHKVTHSEDLIREVESFIGGKKEHGGLGGTFVKPTIASSSDGPDSIVR